MYVRGAPGFAVGTDASERIKYVDGLRAVAILSVVAHHAVKFSPLANPIAQRIIMQGHHGVELFFVLSGFCLAHPVLTQIHQANVANFDAVKYAAKRLTRILPPYYLAIALFALIGPYHISADNVIRQAFFFDRNTQLLNTSFWSLAVEFRWYFVFPLVLVLWIRAPRVFLVAVAGLYALWSTQASNVDIDALPLFMFGIIAADLSIRKPAWTKFALLLFPLSAAIAFIQTPANDPGNVISVAWQATIVLFVVGVGAFKTTRAFLSLSALTAVGMASYAIYLVHEPFIRMIERAHVSPLLSALAGITLGFMFWFIAERPFLQTRAGAALRRDATSVLSRAFQRIGLPQLVALRSSTPSETIQWKVPAFTSNRW